MEYPLRYRVKAKRRGMIPTYWNKFLDELRQDKITVEGEIASLEWLSPAMLLEAFYHWFVKLQRKEQTGSDKE